MPRPTIARVSASRAALLAGSVFAVVGCASGHGKYTTEGLNAAQERMAVIKSGTEWDMARQQFLSGELRKALASVDRSIEINDSVAKAHSLRGRILMELGQLESAVESFRRALVIDPAYVEAHFFLGVLHERFNEYDDALAEYQAASALDPSDAQYVIAAAEVLIDLGRLDAAERMLEDSAARFEHNAGVRQTLGHLALMRGDWGRAAELFDEARLLAPDDASVLEDLAVAQMRARNFVEAEYVLRQLMRDDERADRRDLKRLHARCLVELDRPVEARAILLGLTRDDEGLADADAWIDLGQVALMLGDQQRVRIAAARVAAIAPDRFEGPLLAALWKRMTGDIEGALASADDAVRLAGSRDPTPLVVRGSILKEMGRLAEAEASFVEALGVSPTDARARRMLAAVAEDQ